jgi:hypothetical protein
LREIGTVAVDRPRANGVDGARELVVDSSVAFLLPMV